MLACMTCHRKFGKYSENIHYIWKIFRQNGAKLWPNHGIYGKSTTFGTKTEKYRPVYYCLSYPFSPQSDSTISNNKKLTLIIGKLRIK